TPRAAFKELSTDPLTTLEAIRLAMIAYGDSWQNAVLGENSLGLAQEEVTQCKADHRAFRDEESRFAEAIAALVKDEHLLTAFQGMNRIFQRTSKFENWHLFQIVFIV